MAKTNAEYQRDYRRRQKEKREAEQQAARKRELEDIVAQFEAGFRAAEKDRDEALARVSELETLARHDGHWCPGSRRGNGYCGRCARYVPDEDWA